MKHLLTFWTLIVYVPGLCQHSPEGTEAINQHHTIINTYENYSQVQNFYLSHGLDTAVMIEKHAEPLAAWLQLWKNYPDFAALTLEQQQAVLQNLKNTLMNPSFRIGNPNNPLVLLINSAHQRVSGSQTMAFGFSNSRIVNRGGPFIGENYYNNSNSFYGNVFDLTWEETAVCAMEAIGGAVANGWGTIRQLYNVINGYNLGWSGIMNVTKSAMRTVLGSNAAGMIISFGFCMAGAAIF